MNGYEHAKATLARIGGVWRVVKHLKDAKGTYGFAADNHVRGLRVLYSHTDHYEGDREWLHVSVSRPADWSLPSWDDMHRVKMQFIGEDFEAYLVHPPAARYVNIAQVLHWWACLSVPDGVLPDFTAQSVEEFGVRSI